MSEKIKEYYTVEEIAERLGKHQSTIRRWCQEGLLEGAIKGGLKDRSPWRVPVETVESVRSQIGAE